MGRGQREQVLASKVQGGGEMGWGSWAIPGWGSVSDLLGLLNPQSSDAAGGEGRRWGGGQVSGSNSTSWSLEPVRKVGVFLAQTRVRGRH